VKPEENEAMPDDPNDSEALERDVSGDVADESLESVPEANADSVQVDGTQAVTPSEPAPLDSHARTPSKHPDSPANPTLGGRAWLIRSGLQMVGVMALGAMLLFLVGVAQRTGGSGDRTERQ